MDLDERIASLRSAIELEIAHARSEAIAQLLDITTQVREAQTEADREALFEHARRTFAQPAVLDFLKALPPARSHATHPRPPGHLQAQWFARVRVAEIQLYHAAAIKLGRSSGDIYSALKSQIDAAREAYREQFLTPVNGTADYLHGEFVRTLANDDAKLLGPAYPGPLV